MMHSYMTRPLEGLKVRALVEEQQETLKAYIAHTKDKRWASLAEIHAGAKVLGVNVHAWSEKWTYLVGDEEENTLCKYRMILKHQHYALQESRHRLKKKCKQGEQMGHARVGMRRSVVPIIPNSLLPTSSSHFVTVLVNPYHIQSAPAVNVFTDHHVSSWVRSMVMKVAKPCTVAGLKSILARTFGLNEATLYFHPPGDESSVYPEWLEPQEIMIMEGGDWPPYRPTFMSVTWQTRKFIVPVIEGNHYEFLGYIADIVGIPTRSLTLRTQQGAQWIYPYGMGTTTEVELTHIRVGMR